MTPAPITPADSDDARREEPAAVVGLVVRLGRSGLLRSLIGVGAAPVGDLLDPEEAEDQRKEDADDDRRRRDDRPTMMQATPIAKPSGQRLGSGPSGSLSSMWWWSSAISAARGIQPVVPRSCQSARTAFCTQIPDCVAVTGSHSRDPDPVLGPAAVDEGANVVAHRDRRRPRPSPSSGPFVVASKPILPP